MSAIRADTFNSYVEGNWALFLSTASILSTMEFPNFWTILYYTMLLMGSLIVMVGTNFLYRLQMRTYTSMCMIHPIVYIYIHI